jgi:hypothetical protein
VNPPLRRIVCHACYRSQTYRSQTSCTSCGGQLNLALVKAQLEIQDITEGRHGNKAQDPLRLVPAPAPSSR